MDNYDEIKVIGKGSYGVVNLVKCKVDNKQYVLKKLNLSNVSTKDRLTAEQEAQLLSRLKHPNIVAYKESFETHDKYLCIVMGYCEAGDLYNRLKAQKGKALAERQVIEWFVQIAMALEHMHSQNIMHRDLKTQNIFLTKSKIIKVGDLGIARVLDGSNDMARTLIGTPYYMSPEIFANKPYNFKSDVWALGCCIYEMISLKHAFQGKDMNSLMYRIQRGKMPIMPDIYTEELVNLVKAMLHKNPDKRPRVSRILRDPFVKRSVALILEDSQLSSQTSSRKKRSKPKKEILESVESIEPLNCNNDLPTIAEEATPRPTAEIKRSSSSRRSSNTSIQEHANNVGGQKLKESDDQNKLLKNKKVAGVPKTHESLTSSSSSSSSNDLQQKDRLYNEHSNDQSSNNLHKNLSSNEMQKKHSQQHKEHKEPSRPTTANKDDKADKSSGARERRRQKQEQNMPNRSLANISLIQSNDTRSSINEMSDIADHETHQLILSKSEPSMPSSNSRNQPSNNPLRQVNSSPSKSQSGRQVSSSPSRKQSQSMTSAISENQPRQVNSSPSRSQARQIVSSPSKQISSSLNQNKKLKSPASNSHQSDNFNFPNKFEQNMDEVDKSSLKKSPINSDQFSEFVDSDSDGSDNLAELPVSNKKSNRGINKFICLLGTLTLRQQKEVSPHSSEDEGDAHVAISSKVKAGRPPLSKKRVKCGATFVRGKQVDDEEIILESEPRCTELVAKQEILDVQENEFEKYPQSNDLSITTGRLYDRMISLRKDCMRHIGKDKLYEAFNILDRFDQDEIEPTLISLLGREDYDEYSGKIMQLKYCEESAKGLQFD